MSKLTLHGDLHLAADRRRNPVGRLALVNASTVTRNVWNDHYGTQHAET